jgi:hypothetical protein
LAWHVHVSEYAAVGWRYNAHLDKCEVFLGAVFLGAMMLPCVLQVSFTATS